MQSSTFTSSTTGAELVYWRAWHIGRLELSVGASSAFHKWPTVRHWKSEEVLFAAYWKHRYLAVCWLRA